MLQRTERPGTLFVTGGETLRDLCDALGVSHLEVDGELEPGVPTSILRGGAWDGQRLVSKSGAFGDEGFLGRLLL
jgi:D-threonate/D-erythronate kinase